MWVLWRYAVAEHLVRPDADDEEVQVLTKRLTPSLAAYVVLIGVGLFLPLAAVLGFLTIALYLIVPVGLVRHRRSSGQRGFLRLHQPAGLPRPRPRWTRR